MPPEAALWAGPHSARRRFAVVLTALLGTMAAFSIGACATPTDERPAVVLIVVDTLRADHLGVYGYERNPTSPVIDGWAQQAAVFDNAFATSPWTLPSMGSIYTGHLPTRHGAGVQVRSATHLPAREELDTLVRHADSTFYRLDPDLPTLAEVLHADGYVTGAVVNNPFLDAQFGVERGFDSYDHSPAREQDEPRNARDAIDAALTWLDRHVDDPFFLHLHLFDPHMNYSAPEPFAGRFSRDLAGDLTLPVENFFPIREKIRRRAEDKEQAAALQFALYDEEIAFVDHQIGRLFEFLDEHGRMEDTLFLLTSDHGEEFFDHGAFEHGGTLYDELLRIPLIVSGPGVQPGHRADPASLVDLMATVLDAVGIGDPGGTAGVSLWPNLTQRASFGDRLVFAERPLYGAERKSVLEWPLKAIVDIETGERMLFDLVADPGEKSDLAGEREELVLELLAKLQETMTAADRHGHDNEVSLDAETLDKIRALGYIR